MFFRPYFLKVITYFLKKQGFFFFKYFFFILTFALTANNRKKLIFQKKKDILGFLNFLYLPQITQFPILTTNNATQFHNFLILVF